MISTARLGRGNACMRACVPRDERTYGRTKALSKRRDLRGWVVEPIHDARAGFQCRSRRPVVERRPAAIRRERESFRGWHLGL